MIVFPLPRREVVASKSSAKSLLSHLTQQEANLENARACEGRCCSVLQEDNAREDWLFLQNRESGLVCSKEKNTSLHRRRQTPSV